MDGVTTKTKSGYLLRSACNTGSLVYHNQPCAQGHYAQMVWLFTCLLRQPQRPSQNMVHYCWSLLALWLQGYSLCAVTTLSNPLVPRNHSCNWHFVKTGHKCRFRKLNSRFLYSQPRNFPSSVHNRCGLHTYLLCTTRIRLPSHRTRNHSKGVN